MELFERRQWEIKEYPFRPDTLPHTETIFTIGNGFVGVRGSFEEGYPGDTPTTLAAGIFNHKKGAPVSELVSIPNWLSLRIRVNGDLFSLNQGKILGYERVLNMRTAILYRGALWLSPNRTILRLAFERFASLANPHIMALRLLLQPLSEGVHQFEVCSALDTTVTNPGGINHWTDVTTDLEDNRLVFNGATDQSRYRVSMQSSLDIAETTFAPGNTGKIYIPEHTASFSLNQNQKCYVTKLVALCSSRDSRDPYENCRTILTDAMGTGYETLKAAHTQEWLRYWDHCDIQIEGDEIAQRALRFCIYHTLIAAPRHEERVSIAAKTLSGFGYKGHVFWDTELFLVPPLTMTLPELSRRLLMYRYHNLPGARQKAKAEGYEGAMFPWESTDTGEETTPKWAHQLDAQGNPIRIWTGDHEQHISSDIAYAVIHFWEWTGDDEWFKQYGAEIVLDTAKFWGSRAEYNAEQDRYELRTQIGPDEYHENVDNSVFTNRFVVWHLEQAGRVWEWLNAHHPEKARELAARLKITAKDLILWETIAQKMWIPLYQSEDGVIFEQFEGFFNRLKPINLEDYTPRTVNMDWILGHEKTQTTRVIKQADVIMLLSLFGEKLGAPEFLRRNWDAYAGVVDHGSSLSPSVHARVAAQLGLIEEAYNLFMIGATIDLEDLKGNARDGIHTASCGGVWQAVLLGFCGLHITPDGPAVNPNLPPHWRRVSFKVNYRGKPYPLSVPIHYELASAF